MVSEIDRYVIQQVKERRIDKGVSQTTLAYELDVSPGFIGKIESGKYEKKYSVAQLNKLAFIFKCSPKDFLPEKPLKEKSPA